MKQTDGLQILFEKCPETTLKRTERLLLHKKNAIFLIVEGEINLFLLTPKSEKNPMEGPLKHLRTVHQGELIIPFAPENGKGCCVIGLAYKKTVLREHSVAELKTSLKQHPEAAQELSSQLGQWMLGFSSLLTEKKTPAVDIYLENETQFTFTASQTAMCPNALSLVWMRVLQGRLSPLTLPGFEFKPGLPPFPLIPLITLKAAEDSTVEIVPHQQWAPTDSYWEGLFLFNHFVLQKLIALNREQTLKDQASLAVLSHYEGEQKERLFENVKNLYSKGHVQKLPNENETIQSLRVIGNALKQPLVKYETSLATGTSEAVLDPSIHKRVVDLKDQWWRSDSRPLLGTVEEKTKRSVVALIPDPPRGYLMIKPDAPGPIRVNAALSRQIDSTALMFYRHFPFNKQASVLNLLKFALEGRYKDLFICLGAALLAILLSLFVALANSLIFDFVIPSSDPVLLGQIAGGLCIAALISAIFVAARDLSILRLVGLGFYDLDSSLWQHTLNLPMKFFRKFSTGDLIQRLEGFSAIREMLAANALPILITAFFSFAYVALMLYYSPTLTLVLIGLLIVLIAILMTCLFFSSKIYTIYEQAQGILYGTTFQTINGVSKIRTNGAESRFFNHWETQFLAIKELELRNSRINIIETVASRLFPLFSFLLILVIFLLLITGKNGKESQFITIGSFMAFYAAFTSFYLAIAAVCKFLSAGVRCYPLWNRIKVLLQEPGESEGKLLKYPIGSLTGEVRLDHIYFRYDANSAYIHDDISLYAEPGEFIAIVGRSGCGKSSLVRLLLGFEQPEMGAVYYNGRDLKDIDLTAVRSQIGTVLQDSMIMQGSIRDNITGGRIANDEEIMRAIKLAAFDADLAGMPMGLSTPLISGGIGLSGGQRQRLFMARVLLGKPKILILDEATNAQDNITQDRMATNLDNIHVTRIVIAHRLSTIRKAHRIYVLDKGRIIQSGTFDELVAQKGLFAEFVKNQKL